MDFDQRALDLIAEWQGESYVNESQKMAALQCILIAALGEQHELTKLACCESVRGCEAAGAETRIWRYEAMGACLSV